MHREAIVIFTACKLIPFIIRHAVAISIVADHHYAGLGRASRHIRLGKLIKAIAPYPEVVAVSVDDRMVKAKGHISAISPERYHYIISAADTLLGLPDHIIGGVARLILRHGIDKLSRSRAVFIDPADVGAILHLLMLHTHCELMVIRRQLIYDIKRDGV